MRALLSFIPLALVAALCGCGSSIHDDYGAGPVGHGLYKDAVLDNQQRIAGEDIHVRPLYTTPFEALGDGLHAIFIAPIVRGYDYLNKDTPGIAARKMLEPSSPDTRRIGMLRLVEFQDFRKGEVLKLYANATHDDDYTVRAAALRSLNRCRAKGYTDVYLRCLADEEPLVRLEAANCLGNIPDPAAIRDLISHMQLDISRDVRLSCADALRNFKDQEAAKALVNALSDRDFGIAWQARQSLALLTGQDFRYDEKAWLDFLSNAKPFG